MYKLIVVLLLTTMVVQAQTKAVVKKTLTGHSVILTCTPTVGVGTVTGCNFYRGTVADGESIVAMNATPTLSYTDTSVQALQKYFYKAATFCSSCSPNLSSLSNEVLVTIPGDPQPLPPTLSVGTIAQNKVPLMWKVPTQKDVTINSYNVFRCSVSNCPLRLKVAIVKSTSYTDNCFYLNKVCYYEVSANDTVNGKNKLSPMSNIVRAKVN